MEDPTMTDTENDSLYCLLPAEILIKIFQFLDFNDIQSVKCCCRHWLAVAKLPEFDRNGVIKIMSCNLDNNHPAAEVIFNKQIEKLYLKSIQFGDAAKIFGHIGTSLKELTLKLLPIADGLRLTFEYFNNLQSLKVCQIRLYTFMEDLDTLPYGTLSQLKKLELTGNDTRVNKFLLNCSMRSDNLEILEIQFQKSDEVAVCEVVLKHSHALKRLGLHYNESRLLEESLWTHILPKLNLTELTLQGNFSTVILGCATGAQISLRSLDVAGSGMVNDWYLTLIANSLPGLERLCLAFCGRITNEGVKQLAKLSRLNSLDISFCHQVTSTGVCNIIGQSPNCTLLELHLAEVNIDAKTICVCANNLPNLRILNLSGCSKALTDTAIQEIFDCQRSLRELKLDNCYCFSYHGLLGLDTGSTIQCLQFLQRLSLRGCRQLEDDFLIYGLKLPQLKFLDIMNCDKITNVGIEAVVANCGTIEDISITINKVVKIDAFRSLIGGLKRLRRLTMNNVNGREGIDMLKENGRFRSSTNEATFTRNPSGIQRWGM